MGFETLLGNRRIKDNLSHALQSGRTSHFYLISGPQGSGKHTLAKLLAAAILCRGKDKPCLSCNSCRKLMDGNHPDFITVEDPEHKNVAVKIVRQFREDVFIRPNESDYKIYLFHQDMGVEGQNALLKILEEPPAYGVFLLLSDNPEKLLPTVRSRCVELSLQPLAPEILTPALKKEFPQASSEDIAAAIKRSGGFLGQAMELLRSGEDILPQTKLFLECYGARDSVGLVQLLVPMEKWKRDQLISVLNQWLSLVEEALALRTSGSAAGTLARELGSRRSAKELMDTVLTLQTAIQKAQGNVSPAAICGWLVWELR